jgi:hypothetical protein
LNFDNIILSVPPENLDVIEDQNIRLDEQVSMDTEQDGQIRDLEEFMSAEQKKLFRENRKSLFWTGKTEEEALFNYWRCKMDKIENTTTILLARNETIEIPLEAINMVDIKEGRNFRLFLHF